MPSGNGVVRWVFTDPTDASTYTFSINPSQGGSPQYRKTLSYQATAAPGGKVLAFEGRDQVKTYSVQGVVLEQADYEAMILWFSKRYALQVTDDLGRTFDIYITEFLPERQRSALYQYKHRYTLNYIELDW